ncbi:MAG TPA: hypothetical protein VHW01_10620 [Polyangiaceae bacterium]|nr:hypothetical protein [Polyangiaceae bacterium]
MTRDQSRAAWLRLLFGLALTPTAAWSANALLGNVPVAAGFGNALSFGGAALLPIAGLSLAATCQAVPAFTLSVAAASAAAMLSLALRHATPSTTLLLVDTALVALAWALGASLGRRVQHASHLLPACVVAASADLVSMLSPEGPSHAIAGSDQALSVLATWFPVPGAHAVSPALGVGDLLFMGLVFGVARAHALPYLRTVFLCALGTAVAGFAAAVLGTAIPALLPIAACVLVGLPAVRRLRAADRRAAHWSMIIAGSLALATIVRNFWVRP